MASSAAHTTANLPLFRRLVSEWEAASQASQPTSQSGKIEPSRDDSFARRSGKDILVAFRTRPPLPEEARCKFTADENIYANSRMNEEVGPQATGAVAAEGGTSEAPEPDLDAEFCPGISVPPGVDGKMVAHVPGMKWNGPTLSHKVFEADLAFGPDAANEDVYNRTVLAQDMINLALGGGVGCVLAYGQTGAGKTYTMESLERRLALDLFPAAEALSARFLASQGDQPGQSATSESPSSVQECIFSFSVTFLELLGKRATDLVSPSAGDTADGTAPSAKEVMIHENKLGEVRPLLLESQVHSSEELQDLITRSLAHRRTSPTHRNATSSRSHAILTIRVKNRMVPYADEGQLILVDLSGSERYEDNKAHNKQRMEESREINKSLMNLKECVRAKAKATVEEEAFVHIPFRSNKLTLLLKPIFDIELRQPSKTVIIAHVSPHIQDAAHSVNTLSYASPFKMSPPKPTGPVVYNSADPRTWNHEQTVEWLVAAFTNCALKRKKGINRQREKAAKALGKKIRPLDMSEPVDLAVRVEEFCPAPMTARNLGRLYMNEWVEKCLQTRADVLKGDINGEGDADQAQTDMVKKMAVEVYAKFNDLLSTARYKTQHDMMATRRKITAKEVYGEVPKW
ncbi:hypothetical protein BOTBODRAFT_160588 [Botryobasidium botryosum FD-172 SS1]|uniref:Kinesin motor domain-containing protein n=1 Tax=Botryobasidium botryosum (strain FD-172 SS1) TaxID=930990 RepID=A0A067MCM0_BOTB1|nr:hypothetical protein BOTBODRAFT_160588 [Botryobasidium botryosum FD-172 SS1]